VFELSLDRVLKSLVSLGISKSDAEVYIYLAKEGPKKASELAKALEISRQKLYLNLKKLIEKQIVTTSDNKPSIFSAIAFEEAIDLLIQIKKEQSAAILETKEELISNWKSVDWKKPRKSNTIVS
jgi:sugar-specific transcriptional regulator TrmB